MKAPEIRLVVFDWAGTTIDFGCQAPTGAFLAVFAAHGIDITTPEARAPMGLGKNDHLRALLQMPSIARRWEVQHGRAWTEADVETLYREVMPQQTKAAALYSTLIDDVLPCVDKMRSWGIRIAATTGYFREAADVVYRAAHRQGYDPDFAICADEVPAGRPAPWMIFRAMEALKVYPPSAVLKVGDTLVDIEEGLSAGAWSVGVIDSSNEMGLSAGEFLAFNPRDREARRAVVRTRFVNAGAHAVVNTLSELPVLIESGILHTLDPTHS